MMTVGEMYGQRMMMQARQGGSGGTTGAEQTMSRILLAPTQALRSLGLWDAEVLEGMWHPALGDKVPSVVLFEDGTAVGLTRLFTGKDPERVRVIVLPCSEKGNDCSGKGNE